MAARVGVFVLGPVRPMAVVIGPALFGPTGTVTPGNTPQAPSKPSAKNLSPQFTVACVVVTTCVTATVISDHLEVAPHPPLRQLWSLSSLSIEPDRSWMSKTSGGTTFSGLFTCPQLASTLGGGGGRNPPPSVRVAPDPPVPDPRLAPVPVPGVAAPVPDPPPVPSPSLGVKEHAA